MQKSIRQVTHKPARSATPKRTRATRAEPALQPKIMRLEGDIELIAPRGYCASVLLKLVNRDDGHRYYAWWAMVGRHDLDKISISYKHTGEDMIRIDLPEGMSLSAEALEPHLIAYLASGGLRPPEPPIIRN